MSEGIGRRDLIKLTAATAVAARLVRADTATGQHRFFTAEEFAATDELTDILIPTDEKSPGAKAAKVADYIDQKLAEAFEDEKRDDFRNGLKLFLDKSPEQRLAMLTKASEREKEMQSHRHGQGEGPQPTPEEKFYGLLKEHTIRGYYTSSIGIHQDMDYKGNVLQTGEYAGHLPHE